MMPFGKHFDAVVNDSAKVRGHVTVEWSDDQKHKY